MAAVANVTELADSATIGNALSAVASPAFVKGTVMMNLMYVEDLPERTNVKKFRKLDSATAAIVAEATANAIDANGEIVDTQISATAAKTIVVTGLSVEEQKFGEIDLERVGNEHFSAIARAVDTDAVDDFTGFSTAITATSVMTVDDLMLAQLSIYEANCPNQEIPLVAVLPPQHVYDVKKEIIQSGASAWTSPDKLTVFGEMPVQPNGFVGEVAGIQIFQTTGHGTSGGDTISAVFHPRWATAAMMDTAPTTWVLNKGSEGFYTEIASHFFYDIIEWNDLAGVKVLADT